MSRSVISRIKSEGYRLLAVPVVVIAVFAISLSVFQGLNAGCSALLGGGIWAIPNFYFARRVLTAPRVPLAKPMAWTFYRAEVMKLLLTALLFVVVVKFLTIHPLIVLLAYLLAQIVYWLMIFVHFGLMTRRLR